MQRLYRFSAVFTMILFIACLATFGIQTAFTTEGSVLYENLSTLAGLIIFAIGGSFALTALTGFVLARTGQGEQKKKKHGEAVEMLDEDARLDHIMNQLSLEERDYLERLLEAKRLGVADDGELTSLDDLMQKYEKR